MNIHERDLGELDGRIGGDFDAVFGLFHDQASQQPYVITTEVLTFQIDGLPQLAVGSGITLSNDASGNRNQVAVHYTGAQTAAAAAGPARFRLRIVSSTDATDVNFPITGYAVFQQP